MSLLQLPARCAEVNASQSGEVRLDPDALSFDEKRYFFEELSTPRDDSEHQPEQYSARSTQCSARSTQYSSRSVGHTAKTQEFLMSPRAVPQDGIFLQPFPESTVASPRDLDRTTSGSSSEVYGSGSSSELAIAAAENKEMMRELVKTQGQLAQVQGQLATMLAEVRPIVRSARDLVPVAAMQTALSEKPHRRRRWGSKGPSGPTVAKNDQSVARVARSNYEVPSPARLAAAGTFMLVAYLALACLLLS